MIDPQLLARAFERGFSPLPGKCLIEIDEIPTLIGSIHIPDSAREHRALTEVVGKQVYGDSATTGKVLAVTPRRSPKTGEPVEEEFSPGDRVIFLLLHEDMNQKVIVSRNERVNAVVD